MPKGRKDPISDLSAPLLFAHRGGEFETPASTREGFEHAVSTAKAEVLEITFMRRTTGLGGRQPFGRNDTWFIWHQRGEHL